MSTTSTTGMHRRKGSGSVFRAKNGKWKWSPPSTKTGKGWWKRGRPQGNFDFRFQAERELAQWLEEHKETANDIEQALGGGTTARRLVANDLAAGTAATCH